MHRLDEELIELDSRLAATSANPSSDVAQRDQNSNHDLSTNGDVSLKKAHGRENPGAIPITSTSRTDSASAQQVLQNGHAGPNDTVVLSACTDAAVVDTWRKQIGQREKGLLPMYTHVALRFAELHDTPERMVAKGVIKKVVKWRESRLFFYQRLCFRLAEDSLLNAVKQAEGGGKSWQKMGGKEWLVEHCLQDPSTADCSQWAQECQGHTERSAENDKAILSGQKEALWQTLVRAWARMKALPWSDGKQSGFEQQGDNDCCREEGVLEGRRLEEMISEGLRSLRIKNVAREVEVLGGSRTGDESLQGLQLGLTRILHSLTPEKHAAFLQMMGELAERPHSQNPSM
eukprot:TRINITY_DN11802_c0_g2_i1.p1 TRINITY_DN11802_c0_g2~~TRINITY_DN11802_c0_g2_i1.p1  ORF type:complete len:346 (+),score=49.53 TRINITY_DN11802_c0_g2_i1:1-1038(+)